MNISVVFIFCANNFKIKKWHNQVLALYPDHIAADHLLYSTTGKGLEKYLVNCELLAKCFDCSNILSDTSVTIFTNGETMYRA